MAETLPIKPADLLIDEENPRISEPNDGQNNAIRSLAEHLGPKLQVLATNELNEATLSTPAISDHRLFIRTDEHLYCIIR